MKFTIHNSEHPLLQEGIRTSLLYKNYMGHNTSHTPVWFMRQAGRSLPEYRELRKNNTMLEACDNPELCTEITLQPVSRYQVDAAIFFSDIVFPFYKLGMEVDIEPNVGPVFKHPASNKTEIETICSFKNADYSNLEKSIKSITKELSNTPLIGFAGAPFTVASYLIEGGPTKQALLTKKFMYENNNLWDRLLSWIAEVTADFLIAQVNAGASAIQLFDSWVGYLSLADYRKYVLPYTNKLLTNLTKNCTNSKISEVVEVPIVHFGLLGETILSAVSGLPIDCLGLDNRTNLGEAVDKYGSNFCLQGNLDPAYLLTDWEILRVEAKKVLNLGKQNSHGFVFNLGHGVPQNADPNKISRLVELIKTS